MLFTFTYKATAAMTIKRLLAQHGVSHRLLKKLFDAQCIWVDQEAVTHNLTIAAGSSVRFALPPESGLVLSHEPLAVVVENADWLIINKPAGLASVPGRANPNDSLLNRVGGFLADQGFEGPQPAIITRLDRDTTGLVLVAKHGFAQGRLDAMGVNNQVDKRYLAVVGGQLRQSSGTIDLPLGLAADGIHREVQSDGQSAQTQYMVVAQGRQATLVRVHLLTGRTHQIRAHFAHLSHPLIGDALYGGDTSQFATQLLQASELSFVDPFTQQRVSARLPQPAAWAEALG